MVLVPTSVPGNGSGGSDSAFGCGTKQFRRLWSVVPPKDSRTPKQLKWPKSEKLGVTFDLFWVTFTDLFSRVLFSFFPFCPLCWPPLFLPFSRHLFDLSSPRRKVLCSVEKRVQIRAWRWAALGCTSPQSSGRKFLPEICVKKGQFNPFWVTWASAPQCHFWVTVNSFGLLEFFWWCPKDPAVLKCYGVVIYYHHSNSPFMEISCELSPRKQGVSETLP